MYNVVNVQNSFEKTYDMMSTDLKCVNKQIMKTSQEVFEKSEKINILNTNLINEMNKTISLLSETIDKLHRCSSYPNIIITVLKNIIDISSGGI